MRSISNHLSKALLTLAVIGCSTGVLAATPTVGKASLVLQQPNVSLELANELIDAHHGGLSCRR